MRADMLDNDLHAIVMNFNLASAEQEFQQAVIREPLRGASMIARVGPVCRACPMAE